MKNFKCAIPLSVGGLTGLLCSNSIVIMLSKVDSTAFLNGEYENKTKLLLLTAWTIILIGCVISLRMCNKDDVKRYIPLAGVVPVALILLVLTSCGLLMYDVMNIMIMCIAFIIMPYSLVALIYPKRKKKIAEKIVEELE